MINTMRKYSVVLISAYLVLLISDINAQNITTDTVWDDDVFLDNDIIVSNNATLTINAGVRVEKNDAYD